MNKKIQKLNELIKQLYDITDVEIIENFDDSALIKLIERI